MVSVDLQQEKLLSRSGASLEHLLARVVEQVPTSLVVTDKNGTIEYVNPTFTKVTGYAYDEAIGQNPRVLKSGMQSQVFYENLWQTILSGKVWQGEFHNVKKDGSSYWEKARISPVRDNEGEISHFVAMKQDITDYKRMEEALKKAKDDAEVAARTKRAFLLGMNHEIRTPLNVIDGYVAMLQSIERDNKVANGLVCGIQEASQVLMKLLHDVLELAELENDATASHSSFVDVRHVLRDLEKVFAEDCRRNGMRLVVDTDEDVPVSLKVDVVSLRQVLMRLMGHIVQISPSHEIKVRASSIKGSSSHRVSLAVEILCVGGDNIGSSHKHLFEAFESAQHGFAPTREGLGLAVCKKMVEAMGATVELNYEGNEGLRFVLRRPDVRIGSSSSLAGEPSHSIDINSAVFSASKIFIVSKDIGSREVLKKILSFWDLEVEDACDGHAALRRIVMWKPDLIMLDMDTTHPSVEEIMDELKSNSSLSATPVIMLASQLSRKLRDTIAEKADGVLFLPATREALFEALVEHLRYEVSDVNDALVSSSLVSSDVRLDQVLDSEQSRRLLCAASQLDVEAVEGMAATLEERAPEAAAWLLQKMKNYDFEAIVTQLKK